MTSYQLQGGKGMTKSSYAAGLSASRSSGSRTLADFLFPLSNRKVRKELEEFRIAYEETHGPTDLTKRYTSVWPTADQEWLTANEPKRYFDGLPPFAQAYIKANMEAAAEVGKLDDMPSCYLKVFVGGHMAAISGPSLP
jgi:hypothetical protein